MLHPLVLSYFEEERNVCHSVSSSSYFASLFRHFVSSRCAYVARGARSRVGDVREHRSHVRKVTVVPADDNVPVTERGVQEILTARFVHEEILPRNRGKKLNIYDIAISIYKE